MIRPDGTTRRGFTLIELLVVVAVIAVLLALLLPALARGRGSAFMMIGASNIRQLQLANTLYAEDSGGFYMPGAVRVVQENLHRWHGTRQTTGQAFEAKDGPITAYLDDQAGHAGVRACPVFSPTLDERQTSQRAFELGGGGYGYNNAFVGTQRKARAVGEARVWEVRTTESGSRRVRFAQPTETIAFADAALGGGHGVIEYSFVEPRFWPQFALEFRPDPSIHFRHVGGRANVAWLDGHVSQEVRTMSHWSGLYPTDSRAVGIGWFGDKDTNALFDYE